MLHHGFAIGGEPQVDFDVEISIDRSPDRTRHVFDDASREVMQAGWATVAPSASRARASDGSVMTSNTFNFHRRV
jgi:hypothetical protein